MTWEGKGFQMRQAVRWFEALSDGWKIVVVFTGLPVLIAGVTWVLVMVGGLFDDYPERMERAYSRGYDDGAVVKGDDAFDWIEACDELAEHALDDADVQDRDEWHEYKEGCWDAARGYEYSGW